MVFGKDQDPVANGAKGGAAPRKKLRSVAFDYEILTKEQCMQLLSQAALSDNLTDSQIRAAQAILRVYSNETDVDEPQSFKRLRERVGL